MSKHIVIVGAGFGGVHAALKLANKSGFKVSLISSDIYFEYHAALYRSATGRSPLEVAISLRDFFSYATNIEVIKDTVVSLDAQQQTFLGESNSTYRYDELILALGNVTDFYNVPGLKKYAYGVKSIHQALKLKRHIHEQLTRGNVEHTYVVVGGGATGVELAAEMRTYLDHVRKKHGVKSDGYNVMLIEAGSRVLGALPSSFTSKVEERLRKTGVQLVLDSAVKSETSEYLQLPDTQIASQTVVWTAGVTNHPFFTKYKDIFKLKRLNRVEVNEFLEAAPKIYVIGDSAATQYSGMAQTALYDASFVVNNLFLSQKSQSKASYLAKKPIYAIPVGSRWAAVLWGNITIYGKAGWLLRRLADLRLYLKFLPLPKALTTWRYGFVDDEICPVCKL